MYFDDKKRNVEIRPTSEYTKSEQERVAVMGGDLYEVLAAWYKHTLKFHPDCCWVHHLKGRKPDAGSWNTTSGSMIAVNSW